MTIQDTVPTSTSTDDKNEILNNILDRVLQIVEANGDSVIDSFGIILDSAGEYQFARRMRHSDCALWQMYTEKYIQMT